MKALLKGFWALCRRYSVAMTLNLLGLAVAFTAFLVIMARWEFERNFDRETPNAERIFRLDTRMPERGQAAIVCRPLAELFIQSSPHIEAGALRYIAWLSSDFTVDDALGGRHVYQEHVVSVTPDFPRVFGFEMLEGSMDALTEDNQLLLPESLAHKLFGETPALGRRLDTDLKNAPVENGIYYVGGVYRDFPANSSVNNVIYRSLGDENKTAWDTWNYSFYLLLDDPSSAEGLVDNFKAYIQGMELDFDQEDADEIVITPLRELHYAGDIIYDHIPKISRSTLFLLFSIAWVILLIAAINYTNFSTALSPLRTKSLNIQRVLGGTLGELRWGLLVEAMLVSLTAYVIALLLVDHLWKTGFSDFVAVSLNLADHVGLALGTGVVTLALGLLAGLYPAFHMTSFQPALALKGSFGLSPAGHRLRMALMGIQFVASFALIIGALFMALQNRYTRVASLGYDKDALIVAEMSETMRKAERSVQSDLSRIAGVTGVTFATEAISWADDYMHWGRGYKDGTIDFDLIPVYPDFLRVLDIPVKEGRDFMESDKATGAFIFNETAAKRYHLAAGDKVGDMPVVGIMPDIHYASLRKRIAPMAFLVKDWVSSNMLYIRAKPEADLFAVRSRVEEALHAIDPAYPLNLRFYDEVIEMSYQSERQLSSMILLFSLLAVFISMVGVFGLVVFDSEYKRKEIGVRKVMGATTGEILLQFNKIYVRLLVVSFVIAAPLAWYAVREWLQHFAYKTPMYVWVYAVAFLLVALITVATVTFQNWRAANANPVDCLKSE